MGLDIFQDFMKVLKVSCIKQGLTKYKIMQYNFEPTGHIILILVLEQSNCRITNFSSFMLFYYK